MNKVRFKCLIIKILAPSYLPHLEDDFNLKIILQYAFFQKILRINSHVPWPVHWSSYIGQTDNLTIPKDSIIKAGFTGGCYIQTIGDVEIGHNFIMGMGSKIISSNHDYEDLKEHKKSFVKIGNNVWVGANVVILPGVHIADGSIIGAGSVVTKSIPEPRSIAVGNPAKVLRQI